MCFVLNLPIDKSCFIKSFFLFVPVSPEMHQHQSSSKNFTGCNGSNQQKGVSMPYEYSGNWTGLEVQKKVLL